MRLTAARRLSSALVALLTAAALAGCANTALLHPSTDPLVPGGAERIVLDAQAGSLETWQTPGTRGGTRPVVLAFGGNADRAESLFRRVTEVLDGVPVDVVAVNYPGFGGSAGEATLEGVAAAGTASFDALRRDASSRAVFVWGESLGATVAIHVAAERDVAGVVVRNPPALRRLVVQRHGWWNLWLAAGSVALQVPDALNPPDTAPRASAPAVFVMSPDDRVVPIEYQRRVFAAYGGPRREVLLDGGHNDPLDEWEAEAVRSAIVELL